MDRRLLRILVGGVVLLSASSALAQVPVIRPGREAEVMALFAPHALGGEVTPGWTLDGIRIERSTIRAQLRETSSGATAAIILYHPEHAPDGAERARSFAVAHEGESQSDAARAALVRALHANDDGRFWERDPAFEGSSPRSGEDDSDGDGASWLRSPAVPAVLALVALVGVGLGLLRRRSRER